MGTWGLLSLLLQTALCPGCLRLGAGPGAVLCGFCAEEGPVWQDRHTVRRHCPKCLKVVCKEDQGRLPGLEESSLGEPRGCRNHRQMRTCVSVPVVPDTPFAGKWGRCGVLIPAPRFSDGLRPSSFPVKIPHMLTDLLWVWCWGPGCSHSNCPWTPLPRPQSTPLTMLWLTAWPSPHQTSCLQKLQTDSRESS